jgi:excisionase family DNA binding protein
MLTTLIKPEKAAELLNYSVFSIRRLCAEDKIPHRRIGRTLRFDEAELTQWLRQNSRGPRVLEMLP